MATDPESAVEDLVSPGHVIPWIAADNPGRSPRAPDAAVELARAAGLRPAAAVCAVLGPDGALATLNELAELADQHSLPLVTATALSEELTR